MEKKEIKKWATVFMGVLLLAIAKDFSKGAMLENNRIARSEKEEEITLLLKIEGEDTLQEYLLEMEPLKAEEDAGGEDTLLEEEVLSETELLLKEIERNIEIQMENDTQTHIQLPEKVSGKQLYWEEEKEFLTGKVILLGAVSFVLLIIVRKREEAAEKKRREEAIIYTYPDVVNQLSVLLGAGMTTRQAWMRMAKQYQVKLAEGVVGEQIVYEAILHLAHRMSEGEIERVAYEKFAEEIDVPCFRRLMRALSTNLEKGTMGIRAYLESEEKQAYEIRMLQAKKLGEEASTKMLVPLMLQMVLVMAVVLTPAMLGFMN